VTPVNTLADMLIRLEHCERGVCVLHGEGRDSVVSYATLLARARGLLGLLQQRGLRCGDAVLLFVRNRLAFLDAFWACQLGGMVPVPLSAGLHSEYLHKLLAVAAKFDRPFLFTQRDLWRRLAGSADAETLFARRLCLVEDIAQLASAGVGRPTEGQQTALIQFSSGSTSQPKGVLLSHANVLANIRAISKAAQIDAPDVTLSWMPLSHDMGLIGFHLVPLYNGLQQVQMDSESFLRRPDSWLQAAQRHKASLLCSPNFGYQHYLNSSQLAAPRLDLSHVRLVFNGAEPVSAALCREFAERLAPSGFDARALYPVYGMAEASLAVSFPQPGTGLTSRRLARHRLSVGDRVLEDSGAGHGVELVCLGKPVDGCELRVCDRDGVVLPQGTVGHIQVRGDNVTRGFLRCPECDRALRPDGWLDSGDLGFLDADGLFVTGRAKDILFVNGQNWYPQDIELLLQDKAQVDVGKVAVAAARNANNSADLVLLFAQHRRSLEEFVPLAQRLRAALSEHTGLHADAVVPVSRLPRTTSGKLQRYRLVQSFERGEYEQPLASLQSLGVQPQTATLQNAIERDLLDICRRVFSAQAVTRDQNLFELGADSLVLVKLHQDIEARFPGRVEITDLFDYPSIAALAGYLAEQ
jgi:acyl-CoA synthetase (AMP-forming)/AMP-acid ligase II/acyl carrier protein